MKILLRPNFQRRNTLDATLRIISRLTELGVTPLISYEDMVIAGKPDGCVCANESELLESCDLIMPIGGDGTVLHAARDAIRAGKPLIGINTGSVGFLTQLEISELDALKLLINGEYTVSKRMLLEAEIKTDGILKTFIALNDVVVRREDTNHILDVTVKNADKLVVRQRADGLIFATPTGSTAYSLSAGGPVSSPEMSVMLLTAICSHATFHCSLLLPPENIYTVSETEGTEKYGFSVSVDGISVGRVEGGQNVRITKSQSTVGFVDLGLRDFYGNLSEKLSWRS